MATITSTTTTTTTLIATEAPSVPIVDLAAFTSTSKSSLEDKESTASRLHEALSKNGSVGISGHGISQELLDEAFEMSKAFFDLPYGQKMLAPHPDAAVPHRGYSGVGREHVAAKTALEVEGEEEKEELSTTKDFKEAYDIGHPDNKTQTNVWLPEENLPGFQKFMLSFQDKLNQLARQVFDALILSLDLTDAEAKNVSSLHKAVENHIRLLHYPAVSTDLAADGVLGRLGAHRDWSAFTLLFQDQNDGLEFHDSETNQFIPAPPKDGIVYLNIGDMFQRISNGIYPSALYRVVIPESESGQLSEARFAMPFFVSPAADAVIEPQPSLVGKTGKQEYEAVTFGEYSESMFAKTNVYV